MSLLTTWGYTITDADALSDMLTVNEFNTMTANKFAGDTRISGAISAASMAVRNHCDWHLSPSQACEFTETMLRQNGRIKRIGCDLIIQLPATCVSKVNSVTIDGDDFTEYSLSTNGTLHLFDVPRLSRKSSIVVAYVAGLGDALMNGVKDLVAHRVAHALAAPAGVQSESAGGVSVTYTTNWVNASLTALAETDKEMLAPYKLRGVF